MLLSNVTHERFVPFRRTTILSWLLISLNGFNMIFGEHKEPIFTEWKVFLFIAVITYAAVAHFIYFTFQELMQILGIYFFTIKKRQQPNP